MIAKKQLGELSLTASSTEQNEKLSTLMYESSESPKGRLHFVIGRGKYSNLFSKQRQWNQLELEGAFGEIFCR